MIVSNPPYFPAPDARVKPTSRQIARHEFYLDLETLIQCISELIAENGRCYIVHRADRICDLVALLQQHSMEIKRMYMTKLRPMPAASSSKPSGMPKADAESLNQSF